MTDYWPELENDLTQVIWSHATNSREKLENALQGTTINFFMHQTLDSWTKKVLKTELFHLNTDAKNVSVTFK